MFIVTFCLCAQSPRIDHLPILDNCYGHSGNLPQLLNLFGIINCFFDNNVIILSKQGCCRYKKEHQQQGDNSFHNLQFF